MGVPRVETRRMISRGVGDRTVPPRSSNRSPQGSATVPSTIRRSRTPSSTRAFLRGRSMLWIIFAIQLIGAPANSDKTGDIEVEIKVPSEAKVGSSVELGCEWRLFGRSGLYSVKWYKDDHEFFRYVPEYNPRIQTFPQPGVNIDKWKNEKSIRLRDLGVTSSGQYKCEVSTEAPSFATTYRTANLTVIALPERGPEITGLSSSHYAVGENVTANCTVWPSVPKAALRWVINDCEREDDPIPGTWKLKPRGNTHQPRATRGTRAGVLGGRQRGYDGPRQMHSTDRLERPRNREICADRARQQPTIERWGHSQQRARDASAVHRSFLASFASDPDDIRDVTRTRACVAERFPPRNFLVTSDGCSRLNSRIPLNVIRRQKGLSKSSMGLETLDEHSR
ncbi:uncharacterized protein LOC128874035 isoform X2 [Hylaeus volcanicus]|uniref:uncharacterized protein LOC128874035 isoform X2 n=1 Tax=Hylaeus volcanicus TaxID=313075 RepID=UPI0023B794FF|nr:uncharacterized protein LOC128874035 isoform X2 [Hylaeus volcanicus]